MIVKYLYDLKTYDYILMLDIASHKTGVCLMRIADGVVTYTEQIDIKDSVSEKPFCIYHAVDLLLKKLELIGINKSKILLYKEAMPSQVHGGASSIQTFMALAKSHAIIDLYCELNNIAEYDTIGVYPISTHSYLKHLQGLDSKYKVGKEDIKQYIIDNYDICNNLSYDEYDAIFLAKTFLEVKWNKDIDEKIKEIKKHCKTLKLQSAINNQKDEMSRLKAMKVNET